MEPARGGPDPRVTACRPIRGFGEIPRIRWRFQGRNAVNDGSVHRRGVRSRDRCIRVPEREDDFTVPTTRLLRRTGTATSRWTWWILSGPVRARRSRDAGRGAQRDELLRILRRRHRESDACAARRVFPRRRDPGRAPRGPAGRSLHARLREPADRRLRRPPSNHEGTQACARPPATGFRRRFPAPAVLHRISGTTVFAPARRDDGHGRHVVRTPGKRLDRGPGPFPGPRSGSGLPGGARKSTTSPPRLHPVLPCLGGSLIFVGCTSAGSRRGTADLLERER